MQCTVCSDVRPGRSRRLSARLSSTHRCFARRCLIVDLAPTGRAACALDGTTIKLGEPRLLIVVPKHTGEADSPLRLRLHGSCG